jgi:hypothetical protein
MNTADWHLERCGLAEISVQRLQMSPARECQPRHAATTYGQRIAKPWRVLDDLEAAKEICPPVGQSER